MFSNLMDEYGAEEETEKEDDIAEVVREKGPSDNKVDDKKEGHALMTTERRSTGAIPLKTYTNFLKFAGRLVADFRP